MQKVISICIPTRQRVDILRETLNSIFNQNVDNNLFEVCISDNSETFETKELLDNEFSSNENIVYSHNNCEGFMNSIEALKLGSGKLLKLHNDYSMFNPNQLFEMINSVKQNDESSLMFFTMGKMNGVSTQKICNNFNEYMNFVSIQTTWSSAFAIWKSDFDELMSKNIPLDRMFPHTSLLFALTNKEKYIVDCHSYTKNIPLLKKGGYNIVDNFVRLYLGMVQDIKRQNAITNEVYDKVGKDILKFLAGWFYRLKVEKERFTFSIDNYETIIKETCGEQGLKYFNKVKTAEFTKCTIRRYLSKIKHFIIRK